MQFIIYVTLNNLLFYFIADTKRTLKAFTLFIQHSGQRYVNLDVNNLLYWLEYLMACGGGVIVEAVTNLVAPILSNSDPA